jgi:hypothetical protein
MLSIVLEVECWVRGIFGMGPTHGSFLDTTAPHSPPNFGSLSPVLDSPPFFPLVTTKLALVFSAVVSTFHCNDVL